MFLAHPRESNTEELKLVVIAEVGLCGVSGYVLYG